MTKAPENVLSSHKVRSFTLADMAASVTVDAFSRQDPDWLRPPSDRLPIYWRQMNNLPDGRGTEMRFNSTSIRSTIGCVTTRERAHAVLDQLPEERVDAALAALHAVEGRDTSVEAILARHGEQRLGAEEFDRHFGSLPGDDEG